MYNIGGMISDPNDISALFGGEEVEENVETKEGEDTDTEEEEPQEKTQEKIVTEEGIDSLFGDEEDPSEKVGDEDNEENNSEKEEEPSETKKGSSPNQNLYSSIAKTLAEDGALSFLSEEELDKITDAEGIVAAFKKNDENRLDEQQRRILEALDNNIPTPVIKQWENAINYLDSITTEALEAETPEGEELRKAIIYQYQINLNVGEDRAKKMVQRSIDGGTDVEDAKEYLELLKTDTQNKYNALLEEGKKQSEAIKKQQAEDLDKLKKRFLEDKNLLGDVVIDTKTRQKALENCIKPTFRTKDGKYLTEMQKYISENPQDFQLYATLFFTLTDGFKNMGNILKETVKKEKKKAIKGLEEAINNTQRYPNGILNMNSRDDNSAFRLAPQDKW